MEIKTVPFSDIIKWGSKSVIKSGEGKNIGTYPMFICSDSDIKKYNDFLYNEEALIFGTGGKASLHYYNGKFAYSTDCVVATKINDNFDFKFLYYYLRQNRLQLLQKDFTGSGLQHTSKKKIGKIEVPILSIDVQKNIVSRIEELFSNLDDSVSELQSAKEKLKVYRLAVLKEAFSKVTSYVSLGSISESRLGKMLDKEKNMGTPQKYLRNINVRWLNFDLTDLLEMRIEDSEIEKYSIKYDDLVICEGGEPGRCAVWLNENSIFYQKALHRVRFKGDCNSKFYMYYFWFAAQTGILLPYFTGTGIKHLTGQALKKVLVPTALRHVQNEIVNNIEEHLSICDSIEKTIDEVLQQAEVMRQSILKKAFDGGVI